MPRTTAFGATTGETYGPPLAIRYFILGGERHYYSTQPHGRQIHVSQVRRTDDGTGTSWYQAGRSWMVGSLEEARQSMKDALDPHVTTIRTEAGRERIDRRPGRPEIGQPVNLRLGDDLLAEVDEYADRNGMSRAQATRHLLGAALATIDEGIVEGRAHD